MLNTFSTGEGIPQRFFFFFFSDHSASCSLSLVTNKTLQELRNYFKISYSLIHHVSLFSIEFVSIKIMFEGKDILISHFSVNVHTKRALVCKKQMMKPGTITPVCSVVFPPFHSLPVLCRGCPGQRARQGLCAIGFLVTGGSL